MLVCGWLVVAGMCLLQVYDGGFASHQPCPPGVKRCIKISTSNPAWAKRTGVETFMARILAKGPQAIMAPDPTVRKFPAITPTGSDGGPDPAMVQLAAEKGVDIAPGEERCCFWQLVLVNGEMKRVFLPISSAVC